MRALFRRRAPERCAWRDHAAVGARGPPKTRAASAPFEAGRSPLVEESDEADDGRGGRTRAAASGGAGFRRRSVREPASRRAEGRCPGLSRATAAWTSAGAASSPGAGARSHRRADRICPPFPTRRAFLPSPLARHRRGPGSPARRPRGPEPPSLADFDIDLPSADADLPGHQARRQAGRKGGHDVRRRPPLADGRSPEREGRGSWRPRRSSCRRCRTACRLCRIARRRRGPARGLGRPPSARSAKRGRGSGRSTCPPSGATFPPCSHGHDLPAGLGGRGAASTGRRGGPCPSWLERACPPRCEATATCRSRQRAAGRGQRAAAGRRLVARAGGKRTPLVHGSGPRSCPSRTSASSS